MKKHAREKKEIQRNPNEVHAVGVNVLWKRKNESIIDFRLKLQSVCRSIYL